MIFHIKKKMNNFHSKREWDRIQRVNTKMEVKIRTLYFLLTFSINLKMLKNSLVITFYKS